MSLVRPQEHCLAFLALGEPQWGHPPVPMAQELHFRMSLCLCFLPGLCCRSACLWFFPCMDLAPTASSFSPAPGYSLGLVHALAVPGTVVRWCLELPFAWGSEGCCCPSPATNSDEAQGRFLLSAPFAFSEHCWLGFWWGSSGALSKSSGMVWCAWARAPLQSKLWDQDLLSQEGLFPRQPGLTPPSPLREQRS